MHTLDETRLVAIERSMGSPEHINGSGLVVTDLIGLDGIETCLPARTKGSVLRELVDLAERTGLLYDGKGLLEAVEQREALCTTALPSGIAIPHPRQPMPYVSAEPLICVARLSRGIGFGASDGNLTRIFFLICCHNDRYHLHVLARLMRILDREVIEQILHAETREDLLQTLIAKEKEVIANT
jgi:PTS system nitrogen regulatory IIA component